MGPKVVRNILEKKKLPEVEPPPILPLSSPYPSHCTDRAILSPEIGPNSVYKFTCCLSESIASLLRRRSP